MLDFTDVCYPFEQFPFQRMQFLCVDRVLHLYASDYFDKIPADAVFPIRLCLGRTWDLFMDRRNVLLSNRITL